MLCVSRCPLPKRQHSTRPCLHVMVCTNASCCMVHGWVSESVCSGVMVAGEKGKRQTHSQTKTKRTFPKTTFSLFPFFHLFFFHSFLLAFHSSTITPFLSNHSPVFHASHVYIIGEPKTPMTQHLILFIVFSFCPNSLFLFFSFF